MKGNSIILTIFFFVAGLFLVNTCRAQTWEQRHLDTLLPKLQGAINDTNKVTLLAAISYYYFTIDPDKGIKVGEQGSLLAEKLKWKKGIAKCYKSIGANYWAKRNFTAAQQFFIKALKICEANGDQQAVAWCCQSVATLYSSIYNYPKALEFYQKALKANEKTKDTGFLYGCLVNIGSIYDAEKKYDEALDYYLESLRLAEKVGDNGDIAYRLGIIALVYAEQGNFAKAIEYENASLKLTTTIGIKNDIAGKLRELGNVYFLMADYRKALEYFRKALKLYNNVDTYGGNASRGRCTGDIGKAYFLMANSNTNSQNNQLTINKKKLLMAAVVNFQNALPELRKVNDYEALQDVYFNLSETQNQLGDYYHAINSYKQHILFKDSISGFNKDKEITRYEIDYEYSRQKDSLSFMNELQKKDLKNITREKELAKLKLRQYWLIMIISIISLVFIASYIIFRYRIRGLKLKNELTNEKIEKQLKETKYQQQVNELSFAALRSQMNPHFIFNALNAIQSFVYSSDKKSAVAYLGKFSELIRQILDNSNKKQITLAEEIHVLHLYLDIEKARFGERFQATIDIDPDIDTEASFVIPMLIQPYAENAIKHGLLHLDGEKRLRIHIGKSKDNQMIEIVIDDNGIGRKRSSEINKQRVGHLSFANTANEKRISMIDLPDGRKARLEIIDKNNADGTAAGTTVLISLPLFQTESV